MLHGGLVRHPLYLIEDVPDTGRTTLALQFLLEAAQGECGLCVTLCETAEKLRAAAGWRGWSFDGIDVFENDAIVPPRGTLALVASGLR